MKQPEEALAVLRRSRLFDRASAEDLASLLKESRWRKYPADSYLFREGDPADHLLIVASGEVKISRATESGSDVVFAVLGPGDALGELGAHPSAMWGVVNVLTSYIRTKDEAFVDLAVRDIPGRVARKLLDLAGTQSTFALSQSTLAGLVGASRENVNRALSRFASLGYISLDRGRITLLRPDELRRRGE
ncbi:MAG: Crp/Fnr family transcriptional regulator [Chloroflexi bacterium]|nr:MAG: Crp/Fnr family transcriptional regulator [Chloroflexota bacterium]